MKRFPHEFSRLVKAKVWNGRRTVRPIVRDKDRFRWFPFAVPPENVTGGIRLLERYMAPHLRPVRGPIDPVSITGMRKNYSEVLPKTLRNSAVSLNGVRSAAVSAAREIGLMDLLKSESLREFAATVSGFRINADPALQLIRYMAGDYIGPHNDHHPEYPNLRDGYVDLQITLANDGVARQYFFHERGGFLNRSYNVGIASGVSISILPFWHQVTPLEVRRGRAADAQRWLLLVSFEIGGRI